MLSRWFAAGSGAVGTLALLAGGALAATRPHYGGTLRVEVREPFETADPPQSGFGMADLAGTFTITQWEAGRRAIYTADENAAGGRPFLDTVEVTLGRPLHDQSIDLESGKADVVQIGPNEVRRPAAGRKLWSSAPVRILALVFGSRVDDARIREALALAVNRESIHNVLLQRQGEASGALLPQWLSGHAFLFAPVADIVRARALVAAAPAAARSLTLGVEDPSWRPITDIAERIALNARDAGLAVSMAPQGGKADVRLLEAQMESSDPGRALAGVAQSLGLSEPARSDSPEALYIAERALLEGFRVVPLFHLPDVYGAGARVRGGRGITPLGQWRFENLWVESARP